MKALTIRPKRIQLSRRKGWRKPDGAVVVARPTKWGNPFAVTPELPQRDAVLAFQLWLTTDAAADMPERKARILTDLHTLKGKDLACWCGLDKPCHADVLLRLANEGGE